MDSALTQENDHIEEILEELVLEFCVDSLKNKTFIMSADHDFGISQKIFGEKIYNKRSEDCRDRIMRYLSYCRPI
jgi:hypothetical protein